MGCVERMDILSGRLVFMGLYTYAEVIAYCIWRDLSTNQDSKNYHYFTVLLNSAHLHFSIPFYQQAGVAQTPI